MSFEITGQRQVTFHPDENTLEVFIPIKLIRRGGRTHIQTGDGQIVESAPAHIDIALTKALAQAHTWLQQLASGEYEGVSDLARKRGQTSSYVSRILRLTLLSPALQETILTGRNPGGRTLADFMDGFPLPWHEQQQWINQ